MPKIGKKFTIEGKEVKITELDVLAEKVTVEFENKNKKKVHISELKA